MWGLKYDKFIKTHPQRMNNVMSKTEINNENWGEIRIEELQNLKSRIFP